MRLFEHEAKQLLRNAQIETPLPLEVGTLNSLNFSEPCILKAQILTGNRWHKGLIQPCLSPDEFIPAVEKMKAALAKNDFSPDTLILVEPHVAFDNELYLAIRYDTRSRSPVLLFDPKGGTGIEDRRSDGGLPTYTLSDLSETELPTLHPQLDPGWIKNLLTTFFDNDLTLLEINPLVMIDGQPVALDGKIELEDTATFRHPEWQEYPPRTLFQREPTDHERQAKEVNAADHRGVAGASYFDFPGTIGILASGGGASQLAMDALLASGLEPANYTEYSGNPTREKVKALSEVVLDNPKLEGLWVVGGHANFTDIYETLMGVMDAVVAANLPEGFPVVVRRGGPRTEEAFAALRERATNTGVHLELFNSSFPLTDTVPVLQSAVERFRKAKS